MAKHLFKPGNPGKPKGSKNKNITRERIDQILANPDTWVLFIKQLKTLNPKAYCDIVLRLAEYTTPKLQSQSLSLMDLSENELEFFADNILDQILKNRSHAQEDTLD